MEGFELITRDFFNRTDPVCIAKELIGKMLVSRKKGQITAGIITECEAYWAPEDMASHARNFTRTPRNEIMYAEAGTAYVYICYGIHTLFNVVTAEKEIPHAILIRSIQPVIGLEVMMNRRGKTSLDYSLSSGPGSLSKCLGLEMDDNGKQLTQADSDVFICEAAEITNDRIIATPRIGVESAGASAQLSYRFVLKDNPFISAISFTRKYY